MNFKSAFLFSLLCIGGCSTPEVLESKDGTVPVGIDLSGTWKIRADAAASQSQVRDAIRKTDGIKDDEYFRNSNRQPTGARGGSGSRSSRSKGGLVHVFLELGELLKVSQTAGGLFISFDRSVVEEFRFGENRIVSVGQVEAQRVTGWEGNTLVVDTLGRNNMKLTERFRLLENGSVLERTIMLRSKAKDEESVVQVFDKVN